MFLINETWTNDKKENIKKFSEKNNFLFLKKIK